MTLGGLALAIGILVDNALVEIENIKRQIGLGKDVHTAILDGAREVAFPEFVSTISICIVFLPIFLLTGTAADVSGLWRWRWFLPCSPATCWPVRWCRLWPR